MSKLESKRFLLVHESKSSNIAVIANKKDPQNILKARHPWQSRHKKPLEAISLDLKPSPQQIKPKLANLTNSFTRIFWYIALIL
jgi:hypothetical protein